MVAFKIYEIEVATTKEGNIDIIQLDPLGNSENDAVVRVSPDQVDLLIQHLKTAQGELKSSQGQS